MSAAEKNTDIEAVLDYGELPFAMEPLRFNEQSRHRASLTELAFELVQKSAALRYRLPPGRVAALADLVRSMNCYYSNLIEGHNTHPIDIERALKNDYSDNPRQRDIQIEASAHIEVQKWIDEGGLSGRRALTVAGIREIQRRFFELLPENLLWTEDPDTKERLRIVPGELRNRHVRVGQHIAVSPGAVPRLLDRFEAVYNHQEKAESVLHAAPAHHRLAWIHPFFDGNGRVARLMTHATLLECLDTGGVWSVARGLAREVGRYKQLLANCDLTRRNDLDGRGNLSEEAMAAFTKFFLRTCIDQVEFMDSLIQPDQLRARILVWADEEVRLGTLLPQSGGILQAILFRGELPRGEADTVTGVGDRQTRRVVEALMKKGAIMAESPRGPLRLAFPATLASRWLPGLFPDQAAT